MENKLYLDFEREAIPHINSLYNFALGISSYGKEADKLLQKTYFKAFYFFDKVERGSDTKIWLFRILLNTNNFFDKKKTGMREDINFDEVEIPGNNQQLPIKNISSENLKKAISSLPVDFKILIILRDIENFSYEQIADLVDIPFTIVSSRLYKARRIIYSKLQEISAEN
jgi:RNA polymerase sigma-70 factor, ECF subfamily